MFAEERDKPHHPRTTFAYIGCYQFKNPLVKRTPAIKKNDPNQENNQCHRYGEQYPFRRLA